MEKTKLVSVRVPIDVLEAIDNFCSRYPYRKRSDFIIAGMTLIIEMYKK